MKIRKGFVSNSSSSSFIVTSNDNTCKIKIELDVDLKNYINDEVSSIDELNHYWIKYYGWGQETIEEYLKDSENDEWNIDTYNKCKTAINEGKTIFFGEFSNQGYSSEETFLCENGLENSKDIDIIYSEAGY